MQSTESSKLTHHTWIFLWEFSQPALHSPAIEALLSLSWDSSFLKSKHQPDAETLIALEICAFWLRGTTPVDSVQFLSLGLRHVMRSTRGSLGSLSGWFIQCVVLYKLKHVILLLHNKKPYWNQDQLHAITTLMTVGVVSRIFKISTQNLSQVILSLVWVFGKSHLQKAFMAKARWLRLW